MPDKYTLAEQQFLRWLRYFSPEFYNKLIMSLNTPNNLGNLISGIGDFFDKVVDLGSGYFEYDLQRKMLEEQAKRAQTGLPPLQTPTATQIIVQPAVLTPQQQQTEQLTNQLLKYLPWVLGGLLAIKIVSM